MMASDTGAALAEGVVVTPETNIRAETDIAFADFRRRAGDMINTNAFVRQPTLLSDQPVIRMNRDTLYGSAVVDTEGGATITVPEAADGRYLSVLVIDNDHYAPAVYYAPGTYDLPDETRYVALLYRVQLLDYSDPADVAAANALQDQFVVTASSAVAFPAPQWDVDSMLALRTAYEAEFSTFAQFEPDWMGPRGEVNEDTRHLAAAGAWGLFPETDAVYINYAGPPDAGGLLHGDIRHARDRRVLVDHRLRRRRFHEERCERDQRPQCHAERRWYLHRLLRLRGRMWRQANSRRHQRGLELPHADLPSRPGGPVAGVHSARCFGCPVTRARAVARSAFVRGPFS
jgi:hypothetical protein